MRQLAIVLALMTFVAPACSDKGSSASSPEKKPKKPKKPKKRTAFFGTVTLGKKVRLGHRFDGDEAPKHWHYRVKLKGEEIQSYAWVSPSGKVHETVEFDHHDDGMELRFVDGRGVETERRVLKDDTWTFEARSGEPTYDGCHKTKATYDDEGRLGEETCLDRQSEAQADVDGCTREAWSYDDEHALVRSRCLDEAGKPQDDAGHTHERRYTRGTKGERLDVTFASTGETPPGCDKIAYEYDEALNAIGERCLTADGEAKPYPGSKAVRVARTFDDNGCMTTQRFLDAEGEVVMRAGAAEWRYERDELCEVMVESTHDPEGKLVRSKRARPAKWTYGRNEEGLLTEEKCFDTAEKPTPCRPNRGLATRLRRTYDNRGRLLRWLGFNTRDKPVRLDADYPHEQVFAYDPFGHIVKREFFDEKGEPATALGGVHAITTEYDALGQVTLISNHGVDGELVLPTTHCAQIAMDRNEDHQMVRARCLGTDGKPRRSRLIHNGVHWKGAAVIEVVRESGKLENLLKRTNGTIIATLDCSREGTSCLK